MNEAKLQDFMGKLLTDMGGAAMVASIILGEELGLHRAMADGAPVTADELAGKTGCNARLTREWLSAQAASGYVEHSGGTFRLPPEQAMALAHDSSPVYVAGGMTVLASLFLDKDKLVRAMRGDGGIAWGDHHPCMFSGTERFFRPGYRANLVSASLPALDGAVAKLQAGARIADVGCGHGASTIVMAEAFPNSRFYGFDSHNASIETHGCGPPKRVWPDGLSSRRQPRKIIPSAISTSSASSTACMTWEIRSAPPVTPARRSSRMDRYCWSNRSPTTILMTI
jgi:hypothetical protein